MRFHPLHTQLPLPHRMNHPMGYVVSTLCELAAKEVQAEIQRHADWTEEVEKGKMFGVLVVEDTEGQTGFLAAYSGQLCGRADWDYFVPAVFDYLQPDGYFKQEEARISDINRQVTELEHSEEMKVAENALQTAQETMATEQEAYKAEMNAAKRRRDEMRATIDNIDEAELIRESQFMKAELRRLKQRHAERVGACELRLRELHEKATVLRRERHQRSDALQRWLFQQFVMLNARGEQRDLLQIFEEYTDGLPPAGAGECCAPRLLQYAYAHQLRPVSIAEFWWGQSPVGEVRRHLAYYPACRGKCQPILTFMLQGLDVEPIYQEQPIEATPDIVYEDEWLMVVNKPAGMLSVPGKMEATSVWSFAREHCPDADGPMIVHRLDMATSGLMVVAKTKEVHRRLQEQFLRREVQKTYLAVLDGRVADTVATKGVISLPLRPDIDDRPRQMVDFKHGKRAVTEYEIIGEDDHGRTIVRLHPLTGRTHQLRVHCAHPQGLNCPILGDTLYGHPADRLHLHAAKITFLHPMTKERLEVVIE